MSSTSQFRTYQTRKNYEEAIARHAQYVRWFSSSQCFCTDEFGHPDPSCSICNGRGLLHFHRSERSRQETVIGNGSKFLNVNYTIKSIERISDGSGIEYVYSSFNNTRITMPSKMKKGSYFYIEYTQDLKHNYSGTANYSNGYIQVPFSGVVTKEGTFKGEIVNITSLYNVTKDSEMTIVGYQDDLILSSDVPDPDDDITIDCDYVDPIEIMIVGIEYAFGKYKLVAPEETADAMITFDGGIDIGKNDILSLLKAEQKASVIGNYHETLGVDHYQLPYFRVSRIEYIRDSTGEISGYSIINNNEVYFSGTKPSNKFTIVFFYHPTFIVEQAPALRFAENKVLPRKAKVRFHDMFNRKMSKLTPSGGIF